MYARTPGRPEPSDRPIRIPEHYSGCAFSEPLSNQPSAQFQSDDSKNAPQPPASHSPVPSRSAPSQSPPPNGSARFLNVARPTPPPSAPALPQPHAQQPLSPTCREEIDSPFGKTAFRLPFVKGAEFDDLFLLGLILLLSTSEWDTDVIRLLTLLLFCG